MRPAVDPTLEGCDEELLCCRLVLLVLEPGRGPEDAVFEHPGADLVHLDHVEVAQLVEVPGLRILALQDLGELVVRHRRRGVDLSI